ncbi:MAG: hypothetical protein VX589_07595 [Myxococcota bacterium]|nr:hypothetical protein [Myxococcota bacterium]
MKVFVLSLILALSACGYRWVTPDQPGPVAVLSIGQFLDRTTHGQLGGWIQAYVRRTLDARAAPTLRADAAYRLSGKLVSRGRTTIGYDDETAAMVSRIEVALILQLNHAQRGLVWAGSPTIGRQMYVRGTTPLETRMAERHAIAAATQEAARRALAAYLTAPPLLEIDRS